MPKGHPAATEFVDGLVSAANASVLGGAGADRANAAPPATSMSACVHVRTAGGVGGLGGWRNRPGAVLAMRMAMIGTLNEATKPLEIARRSRLLGVFEGTGGLCSRPENR